MMWLLVGLFAVVCGNFPPGFNALGVVDPDLYHQRYRGVEMDASDQPFFQWWFFWMRDPASGHHFTCMYGMNTATDPANHSGGYVAFSFNGPSGKGFRDDRWSSMDVTEAVAPLWMKVTVGDTAGSLTPLDNNTWRLQGNLYASGDHTFFSSASLRNVSISWDVTITRNSGWYGENGFIDKVANTAGRGMISWNPYAHDSNAAGIIKLGSTSYRLTGSRNAYGDMNWGLRFPSWRPGTKWPERDYGWGWYSMAHRPSNTSIIVGLGLAETGFPLYSVFAGFADISLSGGQQHVTARYVGGLYDSPERVRLISLGSDGEERLFNVTRSQWSNYTDELGTVSIPLRQDLHIETADSQLTVTCLALPERTNRLLVPFQKMVFSDFETLGANCTFKLVTNGQVVVEGTDTEAGLEYGSSLANGPAR